MKQKVVEIKLGVLGQCTQIKIMIKIVTEIDLGIMRQLKIHAVNHTFEIQYWGLKATIFQNFEKVLDFQTKNSPVFPGGHGAAVLGSNFPKSQATWGFLSLL